MAQDFTKLGKLTNSPDSTWDIIVIGSGSNGLVAACYLAAAGKKVLVLERQAWAGGSVASLEMASSGCESERHATIHHMILANPLITRDELGLRSTHGLSYLPLDPLYAVVFERGALPIHRERARTQAAIAALSPADADAYAAFMPAAAA
ncbi:putative fad dependent oxidoreductase protein [Neofusicoccum parvum UCRNP2]|uniref:Putative fad dependent oxidoreductase protein n=1 Tax=Botryosphaeria parva (strain UCR-NP2) TaxID=1287680 RepID=R1EMM8_BOTPV|nr:putative fad dependent oxidoreductase protein [Neofusicoccum parvum UCRNP2]